MQVYSQLTATEIKSSECNHEEKYLSSSFQQKTRLKITDNCKLKQWNPKSNCYFYKPFGTVLTYCTLPGVATNDPGIN
uniref:Uncharacterized protein n=1 Tax=Nelumbo nucifera TaxID=4432 RepID=A0A822Y2V7_NELNU|nr:TPA_asm: hypothetical protein HUJ06_026859 [Nelumbo nucifera]